MKKASLILILLIILVSCEDKSAEPEEDFYLDKIYEAACDDALINSFLDIRDSLTIISEDNKKLIWMDDYVLVVTFTRNPDLYTGKDTVVSDWGDIWVTVVPELKTKFSLMSFPDDSVLSLRTKQMLGKPYVYDYSHFAEIWVKTDDIFRPSPDNEITDSKARINFPPDAEYDYKIWFNINFLKCFYPEEGLRYPWTRLGYTYDWHPDTDKMGLSEFVIKENSKIIINGVYTTKEYLTN